MLQHNLMDNSVNRHTTSVEVYVDESYSADWTYIGYLLIPVDRKNNALSCLQSIRADAEYEKEIHFQECANHSESPHGKKTKVAKLWLNSFAFDTSKLFHFHLHGINRKRLCHEAFGYANQEENIYNRFFRSGLIYSLKSCFDLPVQVTTVYHDDSSMKYHKYFNWHAILKTQEVEPGIEFLTDRIEFIVSDHLEPDHPHPDEATFIQMVDTMLGAMRQCIENSSRKKGKHELAEVVLPLMERITNPKLRNNPNSSYNHQRRVSVSFFPKKRLSLTELQNEFSRLTSRYYCNERLAFAERHQPTLGF